MSTYHDLLEQLVRDNLSKLKYKISKNDIENTLTEVVESSVEKMTELVFSSLLESSAETLNLEKEQTTEFVNRNYERWAEGFKLLEILSLLCSEAGNDFYSKNLINATRNNDVVFGVIGRLHARSCLIVKEIIWLLKGGYADGAHARWRALHEVATTALFINEHGNETATRYMNHEAIANRKSMQQINEYRHRLNVPQIPIDEQEAIEEDYQQAIKKYGNDFKCDYGWACEALDVKKPNFSQIEKSVNLDHLRPYYKWASASVHAGVKGIFYQLGMSEAVEDGLLAGPSNSGMTEPADQTAISISQITVTFLLLYLNTDELITDELITIKIIEKLANEIGPLFSKIERESLNRSKN